LFFLKAYTINSIVNLTIFNFYLEQNGIRNDNFISKFYI